MDEFTSKEIYQYKRDHGMRCPTCGCEEVGWEGDPKEHNIEGGIKITRAMLCNERSCDARWTEVFTLARIIPGLVEHLG